MRATASRARPTPEQLYDIFPEAVRRRMAHALRHGRNGESVITLPAERVDALIEMIRGRHLDPLALAWLCSLGPRHRHSVYQSVDALVAATAEQCAPYAVFGSGEEETLTALADAIERVYGWRNGVRQIERELVDPLDLVDRRWRATERRRISGEVRQIAIATHTLLALPNRPLPQIVASGVTALLRKMSKKSMGGLLGASSVQAFCVRLRGVAHVFIPLEPELVRRAMVRHPQPPAGVARPSPLVHLCSETPLSSLFSTIVHEMIHALDVESIVPLDLDSPVGPDQIVVRTGGLSTQVGTRYELELETLDETAVPGAFGIPVVAGIGQAMNEGWTEARTQRLLPALARVAVGWPRPSDEELAGVYPNETRLAHLLLGEGDELFALAATAEPLAAFPSFLRRRFSPRRAEALAYLIEHHRLQTTQFAVPIFDEVAVGPIPTPPPPLTPEWVAIEHTLSTGMITPTLLEAWLRDGAVDDPPLEMAYRAIAAPYGTEWRAKWRAEETNYEAVHGAISAIRALHLLGEDDEALVLATDLSVRSLPLERVAALRAAGRDDLAYEYTRSLPLDSADAPLGGYLHRDRSVERAAAFAALGRFTEAAMSLETELARFDSAADPEKEHERAPHLRAIRYYHYRATTGR